ncbi:MAG: FAD-binding oxidoreductase [Pseudolabrys sp.]|nr:FAD-binding oxidoreductase [Pseudolabrys sp.]
MTDDTTTAPTWYEATRIAHPQRERLNYDLDVDVCVIGAGLAGLTVAREIAKRGWSMVVLEGSSVASAASGRNTGFVLPGFAESIDNMIERIGLDHTKQLWALSEQGLDYVRRTIDDNNMQGVGKTDGWLHVEKTDNAHETRSAVERLRWIGADAEMWTTEQVRAQLVNRRYFNAVHFRNAFHIHPLNYALGLAALAENAGARIFEETPALSIDAAGVRKRIVTPNGRLRAMHVVLAGNVQLGPLMPKVAATLLPVTTYVMVTEPLGDKLHDLVRYKGAVSDTNRADNHYRIVDGNRLQWSGRMRVWQADPQKFRKALVADIRRNYPDLGPVEVAHLWRGTLGRTIHRMPQIGAIDDGVWLASGFGGHGLNTTAMAGELIARGIVDNDQTWRLFAPYELVWTGGRIGATIAQGLYWARTPKDTLKAALSRGRERRRLAKQARQEAREAALKAGGPLLPPVLPPAAELAAAPLPPLLPEADLPTGEPPEGVPERRKNRGKNSAKRKSSTKKAKLEPVPPTSA